jgi:hypothetical protein
MTIFDLLFIAVFLTGVGALIAAAVAAVRRRRADSLAILRRLGLSAVAYFGTIAIVSLASPQHLLDLGDDQCSDDWCIAVANVRKSPGSAGVSYELTFRISSHARCVAQRERGVVVYLVDGHGHRYDPDPGRSGRSL